MNPSNNKSNPYDRNTHFSSYPQRAYDSANKISEFDDDELLITPPKEEYYQTHKQINREMPANTMFIPPKMPDLDEYDRRLAEIERECAEMNRID